MTRAASSATSGRRSRSPTRPILGFGAPLGAVQSPTHKQSNLGTESEIFLLVFSHGVPGLALFLIWIFYTLFRSAALEIAVGVLGPRHDPA